MRNDSISPVSEGIDNLSESGARFCIEDEQAETLGTFPNGAVCAARKGDQWYFASPLINQAAVLPAYTALVMDAKTGDVLL